jgi:outer membrane immunogenic protein
VLAAVLAVWAESAGAADLPSGRSTVNATHAGWAAGAGAEWSLTGAWSVKAEYLHVDLGTLTDAAANAVGAATITHAHGLTEDMARVGFNYRFAH